MKSESFVAALFAASFVALINATPLLQPRAGEATCGYESCPAINPNLLNVHFVPHTHDDVGWLKTADQYYYGSRGNIQKASVQYIIDTVIEGLLQDPSRKFVYVESAFFSKWWDEQNDAKKEEVKMLVNEGRLEFIGGAWSMNDEAASHYQSLVDQFTWGLSFLNDNFGECGRPRVGWQIDPFGHSREQASLFTKMGYDGMFFSRLDWRDKSKRSTDKTMEMIWQSSENLDDSDLLTGVLFNHYSPPPGFCFDVLCNDEPLIDAGADYNIERRVEEFANFTKRQAASYRTNNIILTFGDDFHYMSAQMWFKNLDKLIKYTNERQSEYQINAFYSTPSCYLKALHDANIEWPTKTDDFFPLGNDPHTYWTGYYTSRPTSKRFERMGNHFLQVSKKLSASATTPEQQYEENLVQLKSQMGVMQHHDAITGTEKQHVADDYHRELYSSIIACQENTKSALNQLLTGMKPSETSVPTNWEFSFNSCLNLNISQCAVSEDSEKFMVTAYNPLGHSTDQFVRFPVSGQRYEVRDASNNVIPSQLVPIPQSIIDLPHREGTSRNELVFYAKDVPAVGYRSYFVSRLAATQSASRNKRLAEPVTIGSDQLSVTFNIDGLMSSITVDGETHNLTQNFIFYRGNVGNNQIFANRSSGAYIFRPDPETSEEIVGTDVSVEVVRGDLFDEAHQVFNEYISQVVRVYKTGTFSQQVVEFEWLVGPISIEDGYGKEIVSRFYSDIKSGQSFYTDANGREILRRTIDFRETFDFDNEEKISGNYYPINSNIAVEDDDLRMAVLPDRAQGGSSLSEGALELMVHRRLLNDDAFGVGEALNEQEYGRGLVARGKHWLVFGKKSGSQPTRKALERLQQNEALMTNWLFFDDVSSMSFSDWSEKYTHSYSAVGKELPSHIYLMTYEPWKKDEYLIRFEHIMDKADDPELSLPYSFDISEIFPGNFQFTEMNLAANQRIEEVNRLHFRPEGSQATNEHFTPSKSVKALSDLTITLNPMQIKTFIMSPSVTTTPAQTLQPTTAPTAASTTAPTDAPTSAPSGAGVISQNLFKFILLIVLAVNAKIIF
ncbi:lysosomal alpha-mannosidase-like [Bradysia coprophila]|uniref:lysosomal alpha-mannosidase-like n=1 Tax=Bradysia coprophila TaxID=38358 RepID=UPI00187D8416|nr:lysosomal alpha-mannosidase-like [Bradysia coprophila]